LCGFIVQHIIKTFCDNTIVILSWDSSRYSN